MNILDAQLKRRRNIGMVKLMNLKQTVVTRILGTFIEESLNL
jgi:hypothetical protein